MFFVSVNKGQIQVSRISQDKSYFAVNIGIYSESATRLNMWHVFLRVSGGLESFVKIVKKNQKDAYITFMHYNGPKKVLLDIQDCCWIPE